MNGIVQQYSADAETLFGWTRDDVIGKMSIAWFHVPKNIPTLVPRLLREAIEKGKFEEEVTLMRKDGATFQAVLTVRPVLRDGRQVGFMGMTKPLTPPTGVPVRKLWFQALRAPFLIASVIPVLVGALAAWTIRSAFDPSFFVLGLFGVAIAYSYVGPPFRLAHHGLGEIAVALEFGPVTVLGTYFVLARAFDPPAIVLSLSLGLLVAGILWINEVPDIPADAFVGKRTLVVRLGVARATTAFASLIAAAYVVLLVGVLFAGLTPWALLGLLALPLATKPVRGLRAAKDDPHALVPSNAAMIMAMLATGILLLVGLALSAILRNPLTGV